MPVPYYWLPFGNGHASLTYLPFARQKTFYVKL